MPRPVLTEDAEQLDRDDREQIRHTEGKLRELYGRRAALIDLVHQHSDAQKDLYDERQRRQAAVEDLYQSHQEMGRRLTDLRRARDQGRGKLEEAIVATRMIRSEMPKGDHATPDQIRREMADLEHRQQTTALPIKEENSLIDRLRSLKTQLTAAERDRALIDGVVAKRKALEDAVRLRKVELDQIQGEFEQVRVERDRAMTGIRTRLVDVGGLLAQLREKAKARGEAMAKVDAMSEEIRNLERDVNARIRATRDRRVEAKRTIGDYNRQVRDSVSGERGYAQAADAQLEELMKRGRVTLRG
ncbi:MAG: hypothetical protein L3K18_08655 [Thermoplasmata archaeon]|nr:hypothetical protein [Thermoplasmata archaeon]MCI4357186.1 hypothetical protein [Thermoplasmata archaeon]